MSVRTVSQNGAGVAPIPEDRATGQQRVGVEVAHEDLIRRWPPLQGWVNANRVALLLRQEVTDAADDWFGEGADPLNDDRLRHTGSQLDLAEALPQRLPQGFNERERRYLDACQDRRKRGVAAEERQRRRELDIKNRWLKFVGVFAVLATIFALVSSILFIEQQRQLRVNLAQALSAQAIAEDARGQDERATLLALQAHEYDEDGEIRGLVGSALQAAAGTPFSSAIVGAQQSWISGLAFSPDGTWLASASDDDSIGLLNMDEPAAPQQVLAEHNAQVTSVAFHPEPLRTLLASGGADGTVRLWQVNTGTQIGPALLSPGGEVRSVAFDGGQILAAGTCGTKDGLPPDGDKRADTCEAGQAIVRLWSLDSLDRPLRDLPVDAELVCAVAFSLDMRWLAVAGCGKPGAPRETVKPDEIGERGNAGEPAEIGEPLEIAAPGELPITCGTRSAPLFLWDMRDVAAEPICLNAHSGDIRALAFSPDGKVLASGGADADVRLWNLEAPGRPRVLRGHDEGIRSLAFSTEGHVLASGSEDGSVGLWIAAEADLNGPACSVITPAGDQTGQPGCDGLWIASRRAAVVTILGRTPEWVRGVAFRGGPGALFASTHAGGTIRLWSLGQTGRAPDFLFGHAAYVRSLDFAPGARAPHLASTAEDGSLRLWTIEPTGARQRLVEVDADRVPGTPRLHVTSVSFNCDGTHLATGSGDGIVRLWDPAAGSPTATRLEDYRDGAVVVAFSPTQNLLVTGTTAATVQFWNPDTGEPVGNRLLGPTGPVTAMAFSQDGGMLAVAYGPNARETRGSIRLWDLRGWHGSGCRSPVPAGATGDTGREPPPVLASYPTASTVTSLSIHPDGTLLAAGDMDGLTRLWDLVSGQEAHAPLAGHDADVRAVEFSPDGTMLATGSNDQTVQIWDTEHWDDSPAQIVGIGEWVRAISFSPDSETLAVASDLGAIRLIVPRTETVAELACARVTRNLSPDEWLHFVGEDKLSPFEWLLQEDFSEYREICPGLPAGPGEPSGIPNATATAGVIARWEPPERRSAWTRRLIL